MSNKWIKQLQAYEDVVKYDYDAFSSENCIYSPSPYANWIFANKSNGIPKGSGILLFSEPKAGKSLFSQAIIGQMHKDDPEGIAIVFNTEMRGQFQSGLFDGIDKDRLVIYDSNRPEDIFDRFEREIVPMVQEGMPLRIVVVDSLTNIAGTKSLSADRSVNDHLVGDHALTITRGLPKLVPYCKRHKILLIGTAQMRANVDASNPYAPKEKMAATWAEKHSFEYFVSLRRANAKDDKEDLEGNKFENDSVKDARGNNDLTGHRIYIKMDQSSIGTAGRSGIFTVDYKRGIINTHEELFDLGKNTGLIKNLGVGSYELYGEKIRGKAEVARRIRENPELSQKLILDIQKIESK